MSLVALVARSCVWDPVQPQSDIEGGSSTAAHELPLVPGWDATHMKADGNFSLFVSVTEKKTTRVTLW